MLSGCSHSWDQARTALVPVAEGVNALDAVTCDLIENADERIAPIVEAEVTTRRTARQRCLDDDETDEDCGVEVDPVAIYREHMAPYYRLVDALELVVDILETGESLIDLWETSSRLPNGWNVFCDELESIFAQVNDILETLEIEIPQSWRLGFDGVIILCRIGS